MGKHDAGDAIRRNVNKRKRGRHKKAAVFTAVPNAEARTAVQWMRACGASNPEIEQRLQLTHDFVWRWSGREDTDIRPGRGPDPIISDKVGKRLAKMICKVRFGSAESIRSRVINPKTKRMVHGDTIRAALEKQGLINKRVQKGQVLTAQQKINRLAWSKEQLDTPPHTL